MRIHAPIGCGPEGYALSGLGTALRIGIGERSERLPHPTSHQNGIAGLSPSPN